MEHIHVSAITGLEVLFWLLIFGPMLRLLAIQLSGTPLGKALAFGY